MLSDEQREVLPDEFREVVEMIHYIDLPSPTDALVRGLSSAYATALLARQRDRQRLRRVLARAKQFKRRVRLTIEIAKGFRNWLFNSERWRKETYYDMMDKWQDGRRWSAAWKAATKLQREARRDVMDDKVYTVYLLNERLNARNVELIAERDDLHRQLKDATDCIMHYAPTDFPILKYDGVAEVVGALIDMKKRTENAKQ